MTTSRQGGVGSWLNRELAQPDPAAVLVIAVLGAAVAPLVIYWGHWSGFSSGSDLLTGTGQYDLWLALLAAETGLWALAVVPLSQAVRDLWPFGSGNWPRIVLSIALLVLMIVVITLVTRQATVHRIYPLPSRRTKLTIIGVIGSLVALLGALAMLLVNAALRRMDAEISSHAGSGDPADERQVALGAGERLVALRAQLQRCLVIEGAIVGAAVLATAGLRSAIVAYAGREHHAQPHAIVPTFPAEDVLAYGAAFTLLLVLFWAPIAYRMKILAGRIRDRVVPGDPSSADWSEWNAQREAYEEYVGLNVTVGDNFRSAVAIFAPLSSALIGLLLKS
jgi:hypothetical protein